MSRWQPDAAARLERAALELFVEQGFADTTVPQITARAGLTTRTFFRHYPDKREVLFAFDEQLPGIVASLMEGLPASYSPMEVITEGLPIIATTQLAGALEYLTTHRAVIESDPGLQERELRKHSMLTEAIREGFLARGEDELTAALGAHLAVTVFTVSITRWIDLVGSKSLSEIMRETAVAVQQITRSSDDR